MKKLIIGFFGGTFVNYQIAKNCEKLGARSFLLDKNKNCYVSKKKNFANIDFNKTGKVIQFIKKKKINFLYTSQSDVGIKSLGYINTKLGLAGTSYSLAKKLTDKIKIRKILKKNGFYQPNFFEIKNKKKPKINFSKKKYLLKPIDSSGSRGIYEIKKSDNLTNLMNNSLKFSKSKKLIIEEKIKGIEFGAQTFSINGYCKNVILHDDIMSKINPKIPIGHLMPFNIIKDKKKISDIKLEIQRAVNILGVENGPCNVDCIYSKNKKLYLLEISPRLGATCLPNILKIYTGIDWDLNTIKLCNSLKIKSIKEKKINAAAMVFESKKDGYLKDISIKKNIKNSKIRLLVKKNQKIEKFTNGSKLFGYIVAFSKNRNYLIKNINKTIRSIKIKFKK